MVCPKDMKVGLHQFAAASLETKLDPIFARRSRHVVRHRRQLLSNSDHAVRVLATVHGIHSLAFGMPSREPCGAVSSDRHAEFRIFKQVQRESWSPGLWRPAYFSLLILLQLSDRPHGNVARYVSQDHKLMGVVSVQPLGVLRLNLRQDGGDEIDRFWRQRRLWIV